jgi:large subunit ribosomal protein L23
MIEENKIIKEYRVTEKSNELISHLNQYTFEVYKEANKFQVAKAVEKQFGVSVARVNILNQSGKAKRNRRQAAGSMGKTASMKKAIVSLKEGDKIEMI